MCDVTKSFRARARPVDFHVIEHENFIRIVSDPTLYPAFKKLPLAELWYSIE